jgi:hypothetical protein
VSPAEVVEAPADETTADPVTAAAPEPTASAVEGGSSGERDETGSGVSERDEASGVGAPVFELPRFGLAASVAYASDAGLSELGCLEDGAAPPERGVRRALGWMGAAAAMAAVAAFITASPWPAGGSLSEPVTAPASPSHPSVAVSTGEVPAALAPSPRVADPAPSPRFGGSPTDGVSAESP